MVIHIVACRNKEKHIKSQQVQKCCIDRILQSDQYFWSIDVDQFRIFLRKIKILYQPRDLFRQVQCDRYDRIFCSILKCSPDQPLLDQRLQLVQDVLLHLFPEKSIRICRMIPDLPALQFPVSEKFRRVHFNRIRWCGSQKRRMIDHHRFRCHQLFDRDPVTLCFPVLHAGYFWKNHRHVHGSVSRTEIWSVFHLRIPEKFDLPVHSLQRDRIGFRKLLIPEYHRVIVHQCIQFPFCMIRGSSYMKLCVLLRKLIQFHWSLIIYLI